MTRAKCRICGAQLDTNTAYKVTDKNGKNKYFCSQSEFDAEEARKKKAAEDKNRVYRLVCDILGEKEIISTALYKEWVVWNKVADNEKISQYLEENKGYLTSALSRITSSEYARIRYLSAIIRDKIKAFVPKSAVEESVQPKAVETTFYEIGDVVHKPTRRALDDLEDEV